jgi:2-polyprenyl-6-methoxyphenol hydroxylase-like FAD-dependent oxidoreductase
MDYQVIIVGGGPVGLTLAIDLGQRGIKCLLLEKRDAPSHLPKMERCHPRTMEHFRRLGIVQAVRSQGFPADNPIDAFLVSSLAEPAIARVPGASVDEVRARSHAKNDGSFPAEPSQVVSQYALEPLLKTIAEGMENLTIRFGCELVSFNEGADGVTAHLRDESGQLSNVTASYLVGCDGAASTVREALGIRLEGQPRLRDHIQAHFYCEDLYDRIGMGKGAHYFRADNQWTFLIAQGDLRHFTLHADIDDPSKMPALFEKIVGMPVKYETRYIGKWTMRLMLAERFASERVFLAGDSVHLVTPIGGLGMNTGVGDAIDLAWKLAATLHGWGGPDLLRTYEMERLPICARNVKASERAYNFRVTWRDACADIDLDNQEDREKIGSLWLDRHRKGSTDLAGITMGYRYLSSPIIDYEADDDGADQLSFQYIPTTRPGARIPHLWLDDGSALQDHVGQGFTLVSFQPMCPVQDELKKTFSSLGCPLDILDLSASKHLQAVYGADLLLLRPDLHIAWRGTAFPDDLVGLVRRSTGHLHRTSASGSQRAA